MRKSGLVLAGASSGVLAAGVLAAALLVAPAARAGATSSGTCSSSAGKCVEVGVSPTSVPAGASATFAFNLTNEATTQQLGSVQITAPSGFVITGVSGSGTFTSSSAQFLNLSIAPMGNATVTVTATAPCGSSSYQWAIVAKQSNNFQGPPGNDFQLDPNSTGLSGTVAGTCTLAFDSNGQPAGTVGGDPIASGFNSAPGKPVKVDILDGTGHLATSSAASVTIILGSNPGSGNLSGTATATASGGVASFSNLSIDKPGLGYTLTAESQGITPATSADFTIWGALDGCSAKPCSASTTSKTTTGTVSVSGTSSQFLGTGLGGVSYSCAGTYQPVSDPFSFDLLDSSGVAQTGAVFSGALEISKSAVQASGHTGASSWQICFASTEPFTALPNTSEFPMIGGIQYQTGLLPDCSSTQGAPCVQARNKDNAGDVVVTFQASGDMTMKG